ncbi:hypothetical protein M8312_13340 [Sphingomonas sp. KRR8]|uniref:hypothetical protein n=1 Tax=Sphingomonas sp. KRR8 TaxID=2942996 RepID=UPI002022963A|nr:hypothetical protein [Sphingomonas sp. KRR8]URD60742.1 hypothetical protein M8312_13340 [Sphingomonas sp. KRR8]
MTALALRQPPAPVIAGPRPVVRGGAVPALSFFALRTSVNARRHANALRCFRRHEFGSGPEAPGPAHIEAVNDMLRAARRSGLAEDRRLAAACRAAVSGDDAACAAMLTAKERHQTLSGEVEKLWEFYFNLFNQRRGPFATLLSGMDRIALDCYQAIYLGLGRARSIPSPSPFTYLETGFGPATFRRGVRLSLIGAKANPFPLVKVPYHRLINPWSLGAIPHEVSHNLQNDLGLWELMPRQILATFAKAGLPRRNAAVWARWHKESYADLAGTLLIGPAYVGSLMDVVGRSRPGAANFSDEAVHPTPIIRVLLNIELLQRMGFGDDARQFRAAWDKLYPSSAWAQVPAWVRDKLPAQISAMVTAICYSPSPEYGGKCLAEVARFEPKHALLTQEAAVRLEAGDSTGVLPERFLIGAARLALARGKVSPETIYRSFYATLGRS